MACLEVDAHVLAITSYACGTLPKASSDGASTPAPPVFRDATQSLEALRTFFEVTDVAGPEEERPQKKRRTEAYPTLPVENSSVVLAKSSINLVLPPVNFLIEC
jgi:hypothetical protein